MINQGKITLTDLTLAEIIPAKEEGAYFIFSANSGNYACRYRCVSAKEAENIKVEHIDAIGREYYGLTTY